MNKNYKAAAKAAKEVTREAQGLLDATEGVVGDRISEARAKLKDSIEIAQEKCEGAWDQTVAIAKKTNKFIVKKPYLALAVGIGAGILVGLATRGGSAED
jgi:ElaB/YqjD/DUF883 family membrane-anchored ribosome-binding protein